MVNYALTRPEVDSNRIALMGLSFGGYLAPRTAVYEHRIAACIANGGIFSVFEGMAAQFQASPKNLKEYLVQNPSDFDDEVIKIARSNTQLRWTIQQGMWTFGVTSPHQWMLKYIDYTMSGIADKITCPTLICDSEADQDFPGQARKLYNARICPREFMFFTSEESAGEHCQVGASALSHQRIFDWLDETFAKIGQQNEKT